VTEDREELEARREKLSEKIHDLANEVEESGDELPEDLQWKLAKTEKEVADLRELARIRIQQYKTASIERDKLLMEVFKLIPTLSTGTLIGLSAVTVGVLSTPFNAIGLLWVSFGLLLFSIGTSVGACFALVLSATENLSPEPRQRDTSKWSSVTRWGFSYGAIFGLTVGILAFLIFLNFNI